MERRRKERVLRKEDGTKRDTESLQTLCLCKFFMLCAAGGAREAGCAVFTSKHLGTFWIRYSAVEQLRKRKVGVSGGAARFVKGEEDSIIKLLAVRLEAADFT